ncbi:DUF4132 domain-containing protein [Cellulomonas wangsupingiae]|uniref:DUF4132 domain-containing protein n=1 Tax=Cellulomonas wangsupingiae TaxID=2968085 RepID=A0ABY5K5I2_9CELL|nr:DUF4132 domain-containing protein [Cellulomonas wangsupingiae]MCC2333780.1 DUF4132 domain-containing protein [Cellulomonas wangsupingiae]UUI65043.1 DUF4132 domain-containing protein [Cellulomonas wangsupingiae]
MAFFGLVRGRTAADDGPPRAWVRDLEQAVAPLPDAPAIVAYVLTGRDPAPVAALSSASSPAYHWLPSGRGHTGAVEAPVVRSLYGGFADVDAAVLRRWGHVLDAADAPMQGWGATAAPLGGALWHDVMIAQMVAATPGADPLPASFADLVRVAALDDVTPRDLVVALLTISVKGRYSHRYDCVELARLPGFADALLEHPDVVNAALTRGAVDARVAALRVVGETLPDDRLGAVVDAIAHAATASSTQVRERGEQLLARAPGATAALRTVAVRGTPPARAHALDLLVRYPEEVEWARRTAAADRAGHVQALLAQWDAAAAAAATGAEDDLLPDPLPPVRWAVPRDAAEASARHLVDLVTDGVTAHNRIVQQHSGRYPGESARLLPSPAPGARDDLVALLTSDDPPWRVTTLGLDHWRASGLLQTMATDGGLDTVRAVKLVVALGLDAVLPGHDGGAHVLRALYARTGAPDLRTLQAMLDAAGVDGFALIWRSWSRRWGPRLGRGWDDADVWPFVAENLDRILDDVSGGEWDMDELSAITAVATLPRQPARVVEHLLSLALGTRKALRGPAQEALAGTPGIAARAAAGLLDGRTQCRLAAAQWLARLADPVALPALQRAWATERQDVVRGALLDALVAVGERAETYLDPQATSRTAAKAVAKGLPAALDWCAWDALPQVRWASSGEPVAIEVLQWLCLTAVKSRSPEPDAVLRQYAALFDPADRERFAHHLLTAWLQADLAPHPPEVAEDQLRAYAPANHFWLTSSGRPYEDMTVEELTAALLPTFLRQPAGSATASKGVLAVVAACGGRDVVAPAERYLREWYGQRAAQGKALIAMLAWVEHPAATQLVLSIGSRFRTKSFQQEAVAQAQALAERKGWTVDELADRTIPTAGFDDDGVLELPYGPRTFVARLLPDLTVEVRDPDGKVLKTLPPPRQSDDQDQAKESRKALTAAKKDVRTIAELQGRRLYEAMCTERSWSAEDWQRYLCAHPVVGPAVRRLVWVATDEGAEPVVFRPLDDGTLTDVDDAPVTLAPSARVRVAHDSILTPEQVAAWTGHLADYEVAPLFQQLGRGLRALTEQDRALLELDDLQGHVLGAFALRSRATRLGWTRGTPEDGGWFYWYAKRFPTLGILASIEFTGNTLPEEDREVALTTLSFCREQQPGAQAERLTLGDVPAVLVSECWHDMREIAAQGSGFDPDWKRREL